MNTYRKHGVFSRIFAAGVAFFVAGTCSHAAQTGHAVYRPGLMQARIPFGEALGFKSSYTGEPFFASNLLENADSSWIDRTLGVFKDGGSDNDAINPVSGKSWPWLIESGHGVFAYEGEIFLTAGTEYSFYGRNHNGEALVIDGATRVSQGPRNAWNYAPEVFGKYVPEKSGWVAFNAWLWSYNGSYGAVSDKSAYGLQWNPDGIVPVQTETTDVFELARDTSRWRRFIDPGDGSFLRTVSGERFTTIGASAAVPGGRTWTLSFSGVPTEATLVAFSGAFDGGHDPKAWSDVSATLVEVPVGDSAATVEVPLADDATVLRFRLATGADAPADGIHPFEEWSEMIAVSPSPVVNINPVLSGYTNAVVSGLVGSFGINGTSAAVTVEIATSDDTDFSAPVATKRLPSESAVGPFEVELFGLVTNASYIARASAANNLGVPGVSPTAAFRTANPGPAEANLAATLATFDGATFAATVLDWGGGSWDAKAWIDISKSDNFPAGSTMTLSVGSISGRLPVTAAASATGLDSGTAYFARLRISNSYGVETVSEAIAFSTSDKPIAFPAPTVVSGRDQVSVSLSPLFVAEGTVYDVELGIDGYEGALQTWKSQTGTGPFERTLTLPGGNTLTFVYTVRWTYEALGLSGVETLQATATAKIADRTATSLPEIDPAIGGAYMRPGETVEVIPSPGSRIDWHTNAVLSVSESKQGTFVVEALEPGATLLYETDTTTGKTNNVTGVAIVLPAEDPEGGIYVRRRLKDFFWTDPEAWEMVAPGPKGYPDAPDAWVYIATPAIGTGGPSLNIEVTQPVTIGNLAVGQLGWIHHGFPKAKSHWSWTFRDKDNFGGSLAFDSGDGSESRILTLGHAYNVSRVQFQIPVSVANDFAVDELWRIQDDIGAWANTWDFGLSFERAIDLGANTFRNIRGNRYHHVESKVWGSVEGNGASARGFLQFYGDIIGSGTIRLEADSMVGCVQSTAHDLSFTGTWDVANGQNISHYGGSGFTWPGTSIGRARELIVRGSWLRADLLQPGGAFARSAEEGDNWHMFSGWTNDWRGVVPPKVTLDGGALYLHPNLLSDEAWSQYNQDSEKKRRISYDVDTFSVPVGPMGFLSVKKSDGNLRYPDQFLTIKKLAIAPDAVLAIEASDSAVNKTNEITIVEEPDGWLDPADSNRQFLPYLFANQQLVNNPQYCGDNPFIIPGSVVDNTFLFFRDRGTGRVFREAPSTDGSGYRRWTADGALQDGESFNAMLIATGKTVSFPSGGEVRNLAGYLDLRGGASIGRVGEDSAATLDFGSELARVYVGNWGETGTIGCMLAGSAGLVKGGSGAVAVGASLSGMKGGIRIAGGTLKLGAEGGVPPRVTGDVVVEAGSCLELSAPTGFNSRSHFGSGSRIVLKDREWISSFAHVRLDADSSVSCLEICGNPVEPGTYGSSKSGARHVDDAHFSGPGILTVRSISTVEPTLWIFK